MFRRLHLAQVGSGPRSSVFCYGEYPMHQRLCLFDKRRFYRLLAWDRTRWCVLLDNFADHARCGSGIIGKCPILFEGHCLHLVPTPDASTRASVASQNSSWHLRWMRPTLGQMREGHCWLWVQCADWRCLHKVAMPLAPWIIRWGSDASSDVLRQCAKCGKCGHKRATLEHPSWGGSDVGFVPFPVDRRHD